MDVKIEALNNNLSNTYLKIINRTAKLFMNNNVLNQFNSNVDLLLNKIVQLLKNSNVILSMKNNAQP